MRRMLRSIIYMPVYLAPPFNILRKDRIMPVTPSPERVREIHMTHEGVKPMMVSLSRVSGVCTDTMLDVGSGEGIMTLLMAEDLRAKKIILTDAASSPVVPLPAHAEFHLIDVCSKAFLEKFQNNVGVVTCFAAFHEFKDPWAAAGQLIMVLPHGGVTLIFDGSEVGWVHLGERVLKSGDESVIQHYREDIRRVRRSGLDTDAGIRNFWEEKVFPKVPGRTDLTFMGDAYMVSYFARQWGEVKQPSPEVARELRRMGHLK